MSFCIAGLTGQFDNNRQHNWNSEYFTKSHVSKLKHEGQEESMNCSTDQNVVPSSSTVFDYSYLRDNNRPNQRIRNNYVSLKEIIFIKNNCLPPNSVKSTLSSCEKSYYKQFVKCFFEEKFLQKTINSKDKIEALPSLKTNNNFLELVWLSMVAKSGLIGLMLFGKF